MTTETFAGFKSIFTLLGVVFLILFIIFFGYIELTGVQNVKFRHGITVFGVFSLCAFAASQTLHLKDRNLIKTRPKRFWFPAVMLMPVLLWFLILFVGDILLPFFYVSLLITFVAALLCRKF